MKILIIHNYYGSSAPSGENVVVDSEVNLLKKHGHDVIQYAEHSDRLRSIGVLGKLLGACIIPWNLLSMFKLKYLINKHHPDVIHVHNTFPIISPSVFWVKRGDTPLVMTFHNYRTMCIAGIPLRKGKVCTVCADKRNPTSGLINRCYRNSFFASFPLWVNVLFHRTLSTWHSRVDGYIFLTKFQKDFFIKAGFSEDKAFVKENFCGPYCRTPLKKSERENYCLFVGRISEEKGVDVLINEWKKNHKLLPKLKIVGVGPLLEKLQESSKEFSDIEFLGSVRNEEIRHIMSKALLLLIPSRSFEGFPIVLLESCSVGTPIGGSNFGSVGQIIDDAKNGFTFDPEKPDNLAPSIIEFISNEKKWNTTSACSYDYYLNRLTEEASYNRLIEIYGLVAQKRI